ncbi:aspartate aminotransferase family protein [Arenibaculum sp.]|uniref:aspartate aminotransferase family protein n=1 Tax=Arenibaculum sp. TaxID=2865862 RepID=UPI002E163D5C|nr:aspartate aminotransferase family protein [Arenibaculum sp.]
MDIHASRSAADWRRADTAHHLHPFTDYKALADEGGSRIITRADGVHLWDSDGRRILDGMAGLWCVNVGYGRRELADVAHRQMLELPYYNTFFKTATIPSVALAEKLSALTPAGLDHVFFANSGSEANDTVVRLVRHYWNLCGKPGKKTFIGRQYGYHGSTMAAVSLSGMAPMHGQADLPLPGFTHVLPPYWYGHGGDMDPEAFGRHAARLLEEKILELGPDSVAAFIGEPIQGAGGVIIPPESYWPEVVRICREHDVLLIADEVICGFGRTGHWFGSDLYGIEPDIMTLAKGITSGYVPLSAVMVGGRVASTLVEDGGEFYHGFTYSGHPLACAVALENIAILERDGLVERTRTDIGPYLQQRLREAFADHPLVGEVRGVGLIAGIELVKDRQRRTFWPGGGKIGQMCRDHCFANDLVMRAVRDTMVLAPPLVITRDEVDDLVERATRAIDATARDLGVM